MSTNRYIDEFFRCRCAPDLCALKIFPNAKEVTESFAAHNAVRTHLALDKNDPSICVLVVGDGCTPRTAATFAFLSKWRCYSVDPTMRWTHDDICRRKINRLSVHRERIEQWEPFPPCRFDTVLVVAVHSHASLMASIHAATKLSNNVAAVSIPCCKAHDYAAPADIEYDDDSIASPKRRVYIWKHIEGLTR